MRRALCLQLALAGWGCSGRAQVPDHPVPDSLTGPATVSSILASGRAGDTVTVAGYCLRIDVQRAVGPPPLTRSDWQLADSIDIGPAIWVSGQRPPGCGYDSGSRERAVIRAMVLIDTVGTGLGSVAPYPRRFLRRLQP